MRVMAIDYGDAHTGVAVSDPTGFLVGTTTTINSWRQEVVVDRLARLIEEHRPVSYTHLTLPTICSV